MVELVVVVVTRYQILFNIRRPQKALLFASGSILVWKRGQAVQKVLYEITMTLSAEVDLKLAPISISREHTKLISPLV